jgi:putative ABC transport system permease protein
VTRRLHAEPPRAIERLLDRALAGAIYRDDIIGDLREAFGTVARRRGPAFARAWYAAQAARLTLRYGLRVTLFSPDTHYAPRARGGTLMDRLLMDVRYAFRSLVKRPTTAAAIVVTLALGIGANAAVFGVVDAMILHPFTMQNVDRIVMPMTTSPRWTGHRETVSPADFLDWRRQIAGGAIEHLAATEWWDANLVGRDEPERVLGFHVSPEFFAALDGRAALGRTFLAKEEVAANAKRVVLSDGLWRRRFGADPAIVGQPVLIDGAQWIVVGVMPPSFTFPQLAEIWSPLSFDDKTARNRSGHYLTVFGRLANGRTLEEARAELKTIAQRLAVEHPDTNAQLGAEVMTLSRGMADVGVPAVLGLWQAAGLFVLLIACANIANLLLARASERDREIAIRLALGSSRARIIRESLLESTILVAVSLPLALAIASASLRLMHAMMPARVVRYIAGWDRLGLDAWTIGGTIACAAIAALMFGALPAMHMARGIVADALKSDGRTGSGPGRQRVRRALVVAEIALALPLLVAAMLSISTIRSFLISWQGYDPTNVLTMRAVLPESRYPDEDSRDRFAQLAIARLAAVPGVLAASVANVVPAVDTNSTRPIEIAGKPIAEVARWPRVDYRVISARYFEALRMPVMSGRAFTTADRKGTEPVAIVSESLARKYWPSSSPIGERVRIADGAWLRVVGVCGDVVHDWFDGRVPTLYRPLAQAPSDALIFAVRTAVDPLTKVADARSAIAQVDATQPVFDIMSLRQVLSERTISLQYIAAVMAAFAGLALLLALLGLYAVMTYLVTQRVREIGVRLALGATGRDVARLTLTQAARLTAIGLAIGLLLAIALGRGMEAGLLGIVSTDLRVTAALAVALGVTALGASYLPARRAASIDPMTALRTE